MRDLARQLISDITSYDLYAQFRVEANNKLVITGRLTPELTERIKRYKTELIYYLTCPPSILGICRNRHRVEWICTKHGLWVCACYLLLPRNEKPVKQPISQLGDYRQKEETTRKVASN